MDAVGVRGGPVDVGHGRFGRLDASDGAEVPRMVQKRVQPPEQNVRQHLSNQLLLSSFRPSLPNVTLALFSAPSQQRMEGG